MSQCQYYNQITDQVSVRPDRQPQGKAKHIPPKPSSVTINIYDHDDQHLIIKLLISITIQAVLRSFIIVPIIPT